MRSASDAGLSLASRSLRLCEWIREYPALGYTTAVVCIAVATGIQWLDQGQFDGAPFLTIYPGIIVATVAGGRGPGFLAALLSGLTQWGWFIPAFHWLAVMTYMFDATVCVMLIVLISETLDMLSLSLEREKLAKQQQELLAQELHHRIQNLFTVIQAVVRFSLPGDRRVDEASIKRRLIDRLHSMSVTHRAITDSMGHGICLTDLINNEIGGFENRFAITGALDLFLRAQMAQNLSLIFHELVTNALKYGALSETRGRVNLRLDWQAPALTITWHEHDGPSVSAPQASGFGSRILDGFARKFCTRVVISYAQNGFRYTLEIHSDEITEAPPCADVGQTPHRPNVADTPERILAAALPG